MYYHDEKSNQTFSTKFVVNFSHIMEDFALFSVINLDEWSNLTINFDQSNYLSLRAEVLTVGTGKMLIREVQVLRPKRILSLFIGKELGYR